MRMAQRHWPRKQLWYRQERSAKDEYGPECMPAWIAQPTHRLDDGVQVQGWSGAIEKPLDRRLQDAQGRGSYQEEG